MSILPNDSQRNKLLHMFADSVVDAMKSNDLSPDDWRELTHLVSLKINESTKIVWAK